MGTRILLFSPTCPPSHDLAVTLPGIKENPPSWQIHLDNWQRRFPPNYFGEKILFHLGLFEIFVSSWLKQDFFNSDPISNLLTLHNLPSVPAAAVTTPKDYDLVLAAHDHRCVRRPLLPEKRDICLSLDKCNNCFLLYQIILKALLSEVFVLKVHLILL